METEMVACTDDNDNFITLHMETRQKKYLIHNNNALRLKKTQEHEETKK